MDVTGQRRISIREMVGEVEIKEILPTGSRHIVSPPVMDTDEDYVVYIDDEPLKDVALHLEDFGWKMDSNKKYHNGNFFSVRQGDINLIVVNNLNYFRRWEWATELAKKLNLKEKEDRVALFEHVLETDIPPLDKYNMGLSQEVFPQEGEAPQRLVWRNDLQRWEEE